MTMKVIHLVRQYFPSIGGMEDVVHNVTQYQRSHGHDVSIVTLDRLFRNSPAKLERHETIHGVPVTRLPFSGSSRYALCPTVLSHIRDADIVHVHGIDFFFDYLAATRLIHGRALVASTHGGFFHTNFVSGIKRAYFNTITRLSSLIYDRIIATSKNDGDIFGNILKPSRLTVIENGVNVRKYSDKAARAPTPVLIYFGRWSANKGLQETLDFFRRLVAKAPAWRLIVAGREYDYDRNALAALVERCGVSEKVRLAPNPSDEELASLIGEASYFICLSRHEGFGIAPIEAMSAGLYPVLSDIPPFRALAEQSGFGTILPGALQNDNDINALLNAHAVDNGKHVRRRADMQTFALRYDWQRVAERYVDVYESLARHT
ncbi:MAG TPA: glycosyltransferase family 4 protein [Rhodocyclaceae bacterium]|nr:glycosyltransferase family 4 protein [Rhodocyclaceae bacterium]